MNLKLKSLHLIHFKGIKDLEIEFSDNTCIRGENESGKTSIMDGFLWLLFGKNSEDQKEFNIKTLKPDGQPEHKLEHEVSGILLADSIEWKLRRVYKERWVKKRGEEFPEFTGHETLFFVNDVPLQANEYKAKIDALVPEETFKLLTNPLAFNSLKWEVRRSTLFNLVTEKSNKEIATGKPEFEKLIESLTGKNLEEYKKEVANSRRLLKEQIEQIPARVDEANRNMPEEPDYEAVNKEIEKLSTELSGIENKLQNSAKAYEIANSDNQAKQNRIYELQRELNAIKSEFLLEKENQEQQNANEKRKLDYELKELQDGITSLDRTIKIKQQTKQDIESYLNELRAKWDNTNKETEPQVSINEVCPTCLRPFDKASQISEKETIINNWKHEKVKRLAEINETGLAQKKELENITLLITELIENKSNLEKELSEKTENSKVTPKPIQMPAVKLRQIEKLETEINQLYKEIKQIVRPSNPELLTQKTGINQEMDILKAKLSVKETIEKTKKRIEELINSEKSLAQQIAQLEKIQFTIQNFEKAKVDAIEADINNLFEHVKFRMFNILINGGLEPCCDTLYKGVPWPDINTAGRIWAGIDIINTLSKHNNIYAPIFIDNRESITLIPETKSQVINLIKDENFKTLTIE
jgi:DNA repair protein SbcC/Rad50